ncbi:hypothetical protein GCM10023200_16270 [Actinomycetospora chlora]|uniref:TIGR02679 family protein n=1 Tax=Actinomycetospora chlora TaxID=663608 RepID=A0ABP9APB1_9PSEU
MSVPDALLAPAFAPVWRQVSAALDRRGLADRGRVRLRGELDRSVHRDLIAFLGHRRQIVLREIDLAQLEDLLRRLGTDLFAVLEAAGCAPTGRKEAREAEQARRGERDDALDGLARERLGDRPWVSDWARAMRRHVTNAQEARRAIDVVHRVLEEADLARGRRSRGEIAALVVPGGAHGLDRGNPARTWIRTALAHRAGEPTAADEPSLWEAAGLPGDVVSKPVLTWHLPLLGDGVATGVRAFTAAGAPTALTTLSIRDLVVDVPPGTVILSVENPRLLEAAVQQRLAAPLVCTSGEPTSGALALLEALRDAGAVVRHHGDVDAGGLRITARLYEHGVDPWRMTAADYRAAIAVAAVELPTVDPAGVPPTPWDPDLQHDVQRAGVAVEQERVMDTVLAAHVTEAGRS